MYFQFLHYLYFNLFGINQKYMLLTYLPELKISAQSDVIYPGVIAPRSPKMGSIKSWNKTVAFFHGKVENSEYPEAETSKI